MRRNPNLFLLLLASACGASQSSSFPVQSFDAYYTESAAGAGPRFQHVVSYSSGSNTVIIEKYNYAPGPVNGNFYEATIDATTKANLTNAFDQLEKYNLEENYLNPTGLNAEFTDALSMTLVFTGIGSSTQPVRKKLVFINTADETSLPEALRTIFDFAASSDIFLR